MIRVHMGHPKQLETQQLLRDILQTLQGMGLRYTLEEETTSTSAATLAQQQPAAAAQPVLPPRPPDGMVRLIMRILF